MDKDKKSKPRGLKITLGSKTFSSRDGGVKRVNAPSSGAKSSPSSDGVKRAKQILTPRDDTQPPRIEAPANSAPVRAEVKFQPRSGKAFLEQQLKPDAQNRPLWVCPDGRIFFETFSPIYKQAYDFLIAVAEPQSRPETIHEYQLTPHSLYAAVSVGIETETIIKILEKLSKVVLSEEIKDFIRKSTENYGKVKLVLKHNKFYVESKNPDLLKELMRDSVVQECIEGETVTSTAALQEQAAAELTREDVYEPVADGNEMEIDPAEPTESPSNGQPSQQAHAFEIKPSKVEKLKQRCLPGGLNFPMLEEYDFRNDSINADLKGELKQDIHHRPYQQKSLSKMFGNGRARSGIIVLPCGAGKSLTGISAAMRIRKSCLVLCTSSVSVDQWRHQFKLWTTLQDHQIARFTSEKKELYKTEAGVMLTTYTMISFAGRRARESEQLMDLITSREWGLLMLDEVHVVPAQMFRKVIGIVKAHCKLGLTATLVREDELITDLNFLIGPKLYEANWLDLTKDGHIANVQCAEVWCPMTKEFFAEYLKQESASKKHLLYVMNPNKFRACQFLVDYHERIRGDKVIVFSDNIYALKTYATELKKPFIFGDTTHAERTRILHAFKHNPAIGTVFLSKVGDNSLDIPEANVLIQISSHAGSRRQEAQRLGRILRPKKRPSGVFRDEQFNAFFYTLVSRDTQEMYFSAKRQQFLIDQGYSFKVITNLLEISEGSDLHFSTQAEQLKLLSRVLSAGQEMAMIESVVDADELHSSASQADLTRHRAPGNMLELTGSQGHRYLEYSVADGTTRPAKKPKTTKLSEDSRKLKKMIFG